MNCPVRKIEDEAGARQVRGRSRYGRWTRGTEARAIALCDGTIDIFAAMLGIDGREIRQAGRSSRDVSQARHIAMYVVHVVLRLSMKEVALGFGRDRTTVVYACHLIEDMRDDIEFDRLVGTFEKIIAAAFAE